MVALPLAIDLIRNKISIVDTSEALVLPIRSYTFE